MVLFLVLCEFAVVLVVEDVGVENCKNDSIRVGLIVVEFLSIVAGRVLFVLAMFVQLILFRQLVSP